MNRQYVWLQTHISNNQRKSFLLVVLFPLTVAGVIFAFCRRITHENFTDTWYNDTIISLPHSSDITDTELSRYDQIVPFWPQYWDQVFSLFAEFSLYFFPPFFMVFGLMFWFHKQLIFGRSGAKTLIGDDLRRVQNLLEPLCISRWLPLPRMGVIHDDACNAFALGRDPRNSWIVVTDGLLATLNDEELEAVLAHELTHIINKDSLTMTLIVVFIGAISWISSLMRRGVRFSWWSSRKDSVKITFFMLIVGVVLSIIASIFFPLIQLAISRKREFLADAGAVELTKNAHGMINALKKISWHSQVKNLTDDDALAVMCIVSPFGSMSGVAWRRHSLRSTHPTIESRIEALERI